MLVELTLFVAAILLILWMTTRKPEKFPPGPPRWPIVGNRIQLRRWGSLPHIAMAEAARRYGDVVGLFSGKIPMVLVSSLDAIKQVSFSDELAGRPISIIHKRVDKGEYGVISIAGEKWKDQRRFTLRHLRDLGFGKRSLEGIAHEELQAIFAAVERMSGGQKAGWANPVPVHDILGTAGINVIWHIIAGERYSHTDPYLIKLIDNVKKLISLSQPSGGTATAFPVFGKIFPQFTPLPKLIELRKTLQQFILEEIGKHRESLDYENPRDFIDIYINEVDKQKDNPSSWYTDRQLVQICVDLFVAGSDTTFNSLTFSLLYMILYPDVQRKVQEELDKIVGKDRLPSLDDRPNLQYLDATLHEVLRFSSVAPLAVPHAPLFAKKDVEFKGYIIPKKSRVLLNLHGLHHDPKIWGDPQNFRPERFLDKNGKFFRHEALLPFGTGKRVCLGESLARNNLFIFFTGLMQRYSMKVPDGHPVPSESPDGGFTLVPKAFKVQVQIRT